MYNLYRSVLLTFLISFYLCSCKKNISVVYFRFPENSIINEKIKVKVLYDGLTIGSVQEREILNDKTILLKSFIKNDSPLKRNLIAIYTKDILGNSHIEMIETPPSRNTEYVDKINDTIYGEYRPLFKEVDSSTKKEILNEINNFKKKLDSIFNKK